ISKRTAILQAIRSFVLGDDGIAGTALIEFTLFAPLLVVMSIYTMDFGLFFYSKMTVQNAAQAGADWAIANRVYNSSLIQNAAQNAARPTIPITAITVNSTEFCGCAFATAPRVRLQSNGNPPDATCSSTPAACSGGETCPGGAPAGNYVSVCVTPDPTTP